MFLSWNGSGNGSDLIKFELSYALAVSPEAVIDTLEFDGDAKGCSVTELSGGMEHIFRLTAYNSVGGTTSTLRLTPNDPDLATVTAVKNEIESSSVAIHKNIANTKDSVLKYLQSYFKRYDGYGVTVSDIIITEFDPAGTKSETDPDARPGYFRYFVEITKGSAKLTTKEISVVIDNSASIVYLQTDRYGITTGEELVIEAITLDVNAERYEWYVSDSESGDGRLALESADGKFSFTRDVPGEYYVYCVCSGIVSSRLKITVSEPFSAVNDIVSVQETAVTSENLILRGDVIPANATNTSIVWSVINDGGCLAEINGRIFTAYKAGTVTIKARIENGTADGDFEKIFYITVKDKNVPAETETDTAEEDTKQYEAELDCSKIKGIEAITVYAENADIQVTPVTDGTIKRILEENGLDEKSVSVIGAVKFVYEEGAIAHRTILKIKGYDDKTVRILSLNGNGGITVTEQMPEKGIVYGNTVSPDTVILLAENGRSDKMIVIISLMIILVPILSAFVFILILRGGSSKRKLKKRK